MEGTPLQISTIADTWIHLNYLVHAGERNRGLSIIKSRGTAHSNQVRELILSDAGVTLADAYTAGGEVLMGTLRWEKERAEQHGKSKAERAARRERTKIEIAEAAIAGRIRALEHELKEKHLEKELLAADAAHREEERLQNRARLGGLRKADSAAAKRR